MVIAINQWLHRFLKNTNSKKISNNDLAGNPLSLTYNTPFDVTVTSGTIASNFPSALGSVSTFSGPVYSLFQSTYSFETALNNLKTSATDFHNNLASYDTMITDGKNNATSVKDSVGNGLKNTNR